MVAFHGYGQDKSSFEPLVTALGKHYTIYAIDLPFHGNTAWKEPHELEKDELKDLVVSFVRETGISGNISLMGYSIGGNYVLGLMQSCPELISEIWLIAADGLSPKPGFYFITRTWPGRLFFRGFVIFPQPVFIALKLIKTANLLPDRVFRFFMVNIESRKKRQLLYLRWRSVSHIRGNLRMIKEKINTYEPAVILLFGKNDGVIPYKSAIRFAQNLKNVHLKITDQGHQMLDMETNRIILEILGKKE